MKLNTVKNTINVLLDARKEQDQFIEALPMSFTTFMLENEYVESMDRVHSSLLDMLFSGYPELLEEVYWFVWDWESGDTITIEKSEEEGAGSITYVINSIDDFIEYLQGCYVFN